MQLSGSQHGERGRQLRRPYPRPIISIWCPHSGSTHSNVCLSSRLNAVMGIRRIKRACLLHFVQEIRGMDFGGCACISLMSYLNQTREPEHFLKQVLRRQYQTRYGRVPSRKS
jgi:hypothetical protein